MANAHLKTYLNDHLAGSVSAIALLENIATCYAGTDVEKLARKLHKDVSADAEQLSALMAQLGISESSPRKASAWLVEKMAELKLRISDPASGALRLLESIEAITLGVEGKRLLWRSLAASAEQALNLRGPDYDRLIQRAEDQRRELEAVRIETARKALAAVP